MNNPTRRQHYVQQAYLKAWAASPIADEKIYALRKGHKFFSTKIHSTAVEKDFYKTEFLTELELAYLISLHTIDNYRTIKFGILELLRETRKIKNQDFYVHDVNITLFEKINCIYEKHFLIIKKILENNNFDLLYNDEDRSELILYINLQAFRGKSYKDFILNKNIKFNEKIIKDNIANINKLANHYKIIINKEFLDMQLLSPNAFFRIEVMQPYFMFLNINAHSFNDNTGKHIITVLHTASETEFLTSDHPVVKTYEDGETLYYPLSPKIAITISHNTETVIEHKNLSLAETIEYNKLLYNADCTTLYATDKNIFIQNHIPIEKSP